MPSSRSTLVPGTASGRSKSTQPHASLLIHTLPPALPVRPRVISAVLIGCAHSLAYVEMRLILARVIWNFDLKLADDSKDWLSRQKIYLLWQKGPLNMYLTPRAEE